MQRQWPPARGDEEVSHESLVRRRTGGGCQGATVGKIHRPGGPNQVQGHAGVPEAVGQEPQVRGTRVGGDDVSLGDDGGQGPEEEAVVGQVGQVFRQLVQDVRHGREEGERVVVSVRMWRTLVEK